MHLRPPARLLAAGGALALATVLSSCGFDYATDRPYTPAAGGNDQTLEMDVLGAVVVSGQDGSGTFVASFSNNYQDETASVVSLSGEGLEFEDFGPIEIEAGELVNIEDEGVVVTGDLGPGDVVTLQIGFGDGTNTELEVPVVPPCDEFEGLDVSSEGSGETFDCEVAPPVGTGTEH